MATQLLLSFPPPTELPDAEYDQKIRVLCAGIKKLSPSALVGHSTAEQGNHLDILDPAKHSLAYLQVLLAYYQISQKPGKLTIPDTFQPGGEAWGRALEFFEVFDPIQIRYAGRDFTRLVETIARIAESVSRPLLAVQPLKSALLRLDPSCSTLTTTHTLFVRTCLKAKACRAALPVLEKTVCHIPASADKIYHQRAQIYPCDKDQSSVTYITDSSGLAGSLTYRTYLEYYLYGAMIYMVRKEWENALRFLHLVIVAPATNSVSKIMVEAYKKWIISSSMPRGTPQYAIKAYKNLARPYEVLAEIFRDGTLQRLEAEISIGAGVWDEDNNSGLVRQLPDAYRQFSILKLEKVFAALSIPDMASRVSSESTSTAELEEFVATLIAKGQLDARLVQASDPSGASVLRFGRTNKAMDPYLEARLWEDLVKEKIRIKSMIKNVARADLKLELGGDYIEGLGKSQRRAEQVAHSRTSAFDEDIMGVSR
ncbi:COP9 signalosome complex subunit 3 [Arthroderma uncinatum]|uniref:COP9 signalosome complex subunit 3 n=1 Tax=Arthroderma uncinatum TaxID=74035 RepID=UPI00144A65F9|nr:COP9 signalosome complex subunit 3 [Arthroderma uncinatum]KAF3492041.1 COP9 signalosome complex subunit 3 [Arthroderma uncinatum]